MIAFVAPVARARHKPASDWNEFQRVWVRIENTEKPSVALDALKKMLNFLRGLENGRFPLLVFGPQSVSYERSRHENRTILREISTRVFFVKIPKINKNHISNISRISGKWKE